MVYLNKLYPLIGIYAEPKRNAVHKNKDRANYITRSNEEDGVLKMTIYMLSLQ